MIGFRLAFDTKGGFAKARAAIPLAIARGLNEGGDRVRTEVQRSLWKQTGAKKYKSITSRVRTARAYAEGAAPKSGIGPTRGPGLSYQIIVAGKPVMRLDEFPVSVTSRGVDAKTWGVDHLFQRSFVVAGEKNPFKARLGAARLPIRGLLGPNLAKELDRGDTPKRFILYSRAYVGPAILKHMAKALG